MKILGVMLSGCNLGGWQTFFDEISSVLTEAELGELQRIYLMIVDTEKKIQNGWAFTNDSGRLEARQKVCATLQEIQEWFEELKQNKQGQVAIPTFCDTWIKWTQDKAKTVEQLTETLNEMGWWQAMQNAQRQK